MEEAYLEEIEATADLSGGTIVRRVGNGKDQQGTFRRVADEGDGWVVTDVINPTEGEYIAEAGIIRPAEGDRLFKHKDRFDGTGSSEAAMEILLTWPLYRDNPLLKKDMLEFVTAAYSPGQILTLKKKDQLKTLFVPLQQKFKIGRFVEKVNPNVLRDSRFEEQLTALNSGKHLTYIAFIPRDSNHKPLFFSYGTKPHIETKRELDRQVYSFRPTHGGHIKCMEDEPGQTKKFMVDAGSNEFGVGTQTPLSTAEMITESLKDMWPQFEYVPVPGRDAFGIQQSY